MKRISLLGTITFFFIGLTSFSADEPPSWREFEVKSSSGKFLAEIAASDKSGGDRPWQWKYSLSVFELNQNSKEKIWSCPYAYDGYPGGLLSENGAAFACINFWYYADYPVVLIYYRGEKTASLKGREFRVPETELLNTVSHQLWLRQEGLRSEFVESESGTVVLEIFTIDGGKHSIDARTGELLK